MLRARAQLLPGAVDELLRFTTPVSIGASMYATENLELAGTGVRRGEIVTCALLAADHDPHEFDRPERLDIAHPARHGEHHLAFGRGAHYCLGAALARLQAEVALRQLFIERDGLSLAVRRAELRYAAWPGEGNHLLALPVHL